MLKFQISALLRNLGATLVVPVTSKKLQATFVDDVLQKNAAKLIENEKDKLGIKTVISASRQIDIHFTE